jgi:hypothetical protein
MGPTTRAVLDTVAGALSNLGRGASGETIHSTVRGLLLGDLLDNAFSDEVAAELKA